MSPIHAAGGHEFNFTDANLPKTYSLHSKTVLVVGGGGREHAIVDALSRSPQVGKIYCAPGNAGIGQIAENVPLKDTDVEGLKAFAMGHGVDLTVVGPEAALSVGIVDAFRAAGLRIFGHTQSATRIESSKEFAKVLMDKYGIPTAGYRSFTSYDEALAYVSARPFPAVLKYDGLAAGKGVVIAEDLEAADAALKDMLLDGCFGEGKVVVEDFLTGPEFSFMCFVSGGRVLPMPLSQDHKRAYDGDRGPNTGGMGAYTGLPFITGEDREFALKEIMQKAADAMVAEGCPLSGVLYGGLMKTPQGVKVIEFNARFGDPETEVVLPLLESDIYDIFSAAADGASFPEEVRWSNKVTMGVVLASKGYPGSYEKGFEILGLEYIHCRHGEGHGCCGGHGEGEGCGCHGDEGCCSEGSGCGCHGEGHDGCGCHGGHGDEGCCGEGSGCGCHGDEKGGCCHHGESHDGCGCHGDGHEGCGCHGEGHDGCGCHDDGHICGTVYHMGTKLVDGHIVTNGGRVLMVVCKGRDIIEARVKVYRALSVIQCPNLFYRNDIAHYAL